MAQNETVITAISKISDKPLNLDAALVVIYGQDLGRKYDLKQAETVIGRSSKADICVDQESVSRNHAQITSSKKGVRIKDMGSTNGTFVNDYAVEDGGDQELRNGDLVKIGRTIFKFIAGGNIEAAYHDEIYRMTTMDGLTQVHNRRYFDEQIDRELSRSRRYERVLSLVMMDIDYFKRINDTYGHPFGDEVLRAVSQVTRARLREVDMLARYGGEELIALLPETSPADALRACERVREAIESLQLEHHATDGTKRMVRCTASLGLASIPSPTLQNAQELLRAADECLYAAKGAGRNRIVLSHPSGPVTFSAGTAVAVPT